MLAKVINSLNTGVPGNSSRAKVGIKVAPVQISMWCNAIAKEQYINILRPIRFFINFDQVMQK